MNIYLFVINFNMSNITYSKLFYKQLIGVMHWFHTILALYSFVLLSIKFSWEGEILSLNGHLLKRHLQPSGPAKVVR